MRAVSRHKRNDVVECEFLSGYEPRDKDIQHYPPALQEELCAGEQKYESSHSIYDPIIIDNIERSYVGAKNEFILQKIQEIRLEKTAIEGEPESLFACPCCRYLTLPEENAYDICSVCFWEDDGAIKDEDYSGPNHKTLKEGRENFSKLGACDEKSKQHVEAEGIYKYHRKWVY
ncbi:hypothetical protein DKT75_10515 [Leucothrix arctica]|uniref:Cysteine-rich CPCC domain-containing protein n=2 Tax=Leucothrix arctica TaxID=1481894 RepID=A0A317CDH2_9GAMM|nr:hypothetical protein DKT75_10515 [Leucothrix arctica]